MLNIGDVLDNKYTIIKKIGRGGSGCVYLAQNNKLGTMWAIKEIIQSNTHYTDFLTETEILKKVNHRSIPRIIDFLETEHSFYIIEDYIEGISLKDLIEEGCEISDQNVLRWAKQLCEILIYLHNIRPNPIIYRDMKPGNVIITKDNNATIVDLGIAREFKEGNDSDTSYIGTRGYAAPEQYSGLGQTDERTDIYGLGATLYHLFTGANPVNKTSTPIKGQSCSRPPLERIITKCLELDPVKRYQTATELFFELENINNSSESRSKTKFNNVTSKLIVIGSISPRAGSSFITANLAAALTSFGIRTAVIEHPVNTPYLYDALFVEGRKQNNLVWPQQIISDDRIDSASIYIESGIQWFITDPNVNSADNWSTDNMLKLIYLTKKVPAVILDVSTNWFHPSVRNILGQADQILLVLDPDPVIVQRINTEWPKEEVAEHGNPTKENQIANLLLEVSDKHDVKVAAVINKKTSQMNKFKLTLPFINLIHVPHISPDLSYRALWEGVVTYHYSEVKPLLDQAFSPLIDTLFETAGQELCNEKPKTAFVNKVRTIYNILKGFKEEVR